MRQAALVLAASFLLAAIFATGAAAMAGEPGRDGFDWQPWRYLPVQDGGRQKPLDSLAWETLRLLCNRASFADPQTHARLDATGVYLAMLFDWQGWDEPAAGKTSAGGSSEGDKPAPGHGMSGHGMPGHAGGMGDPLAAYFRSHEPDKWDRAKLLRVDYLALRKALSIEADQKYVSPLELSKAEITDPQTGRTEPFLAWAGRLLASQPQGLTVFETKAAELAHAFWSYVDHRTGKRLRIVPAPGASDQPWISVGQLLRSDFDDTTDPQGSLRAIQAELRRARAAYLVGNPDRFNEASAALLAAVRQAGPQLGDYPVERLIGLEVAYNHWVPFRFAWVLVLAALLGVALSVALKRQWIYAASLGIYAAGVVAMVVGFGMRLAISGRAPVTNMYESVIYVGFGTALIGLAFELIYRRRYILAAAASVSTLALILADNCPALLDPSLQPLQPVLRSNFWLVTHVLTITLSYAAFALALGISNITLGYYLVRSRNRDAVVALSRFTYQSLQVGVLLLFVGTVLGAVWADYAWGRFWGWDPKEVWALIALLGYLALLHGRYIGWIGQFGLAAASVACFSLVVIAWYGVNYILGAGLHSYGFGGGGQTYVYGALAVQAAYVAAAAFRYLTAGRRVEGPSHGTAAAPAMHKPAERAEQLVR